MSSIYNSNITTDKEPSTKQFTPTTKIEPQILSGNWTFRVDQGLLKEQELRSISLCLTIY
jgi:hypothetical protein